MQVRSTSAERGTRLTPVSTDLSHGLKEFLTEEYFDDDTPDDGEIYRRIRRQFLFLSQNWMSLYSSIHRVIRNSTLRSPYDE